MCVIKKRWGVAIMDNGNHEGENLGTSAFFNGAMRLCLAMVFAV